MSLKNSKGLKQKTVRMGLQKKNMKLPVLLILIPVSKTMSGGDEGTYRAVLFPLLSPSEMSQIAFNFSSLCHWQLFTMLGTLFLLSWEI